MGWTIPISANVTLHEADALGPVPRAEFDAATMLAKLATAVKIAPRMLTVTRFALTAYSDAQSDSICMLSRDGRRAVDEAL